MTKTKNKKTKQIEIDCYVLRSEAIKHITSIDLWTISLLN